jgi:hypothetical protein
MEKIKSSLYGENGSYVQNTKIYAWGAHELLLTYVLMIKGYKIWLKPYLFSCLIKIKIGMNFIK